MKQAMRNIVKKFPPMYRLYNRMRGYRLHDPDIRIPFVHLGTEYGGWAVPREIAQGSPVVYSVGVGADISFDLALGQNARVYLFDPTPVAVKFINSLMLPANIVFMPIGLADEDGSAPFEVPDNPDDASYSKPSQARKEAKCIDCKVLTLRSIREQLCHDQIDILKIDIAGFEYSVIDNLIADTEQPKCLLVEFHHRCFGYQSEETKNAVQKLRKYGYRSFWISDLGREYDFVKTV